MLHFNDLRTYQQFQKDLKTEDGQGLLNLISRLANSGDAPQMVVLYTSRDDDLGKYYDFSLHKLKVDELYIDGTGAERPELSSVHHTLPSISNRQIVGGFVLGANGWSAHT